MDRTSHDTTTGGGVRRRTSDGLGRHARLMALVALLTMLASAFVVLAPNRAAAAAGRQVMQTSGTDVTTTTATPDTTTPAPDTTPTTVAPPPDTTPAPDTTPTTVAPPPDTTSTTAPKPAQPGPPAAAAEAADTAAEIVKSLDPVQGGGYTAPNTFDAGATVRYKLLLKCASLTQECGIGTVTDVLDPSLVFRSVIVPQTTFPVVASASGQTVTVKIGSATQPWLAGQLELVLVADVRSNAVPGDIPNSVNVAITNGTGGQSGPVIIKVPAPTPRWGLDKQLTTANPVVGEPVNFSVVFTLPTRFGNVDVQSGTLVDTYPAGAEVVNADGGVVDTVNHTITWVTGALPSSTRVNCDTSGQNCTTYFRKNFTLRFPAATFADVPTVTNTVDAHLVFVDGSETDLSDSVDVTFTEGVPSNPSFKNGPAQIVTGATIEWRIYSNNGGNTTLTNLTVTDTLPDGVTDFTLVRPYRDYNPANPTTVKVTFEYQDAGGAWLPWFVHNTADPGYDNSWTTKPLPAGATAWRMTGDSLLPTQYLGIYLRGTVTAVAPEIVHNCATSVSDTTALVTKCADTTVTTPFSTVSVVKGHQFLNNDPAQTSAVPGEEFRFIVAFRALGPTPVSQMDVQDLLPPQFEFVSTECWGRGGDAYYKSWEQGIFASCTNGTALPGTPTASVSTSASGTSLHWLATAPGGGTFDPALYYGIVFRVRVKPATSNANYTNVENAIIHDADVNTVCASGYGPQRGVVDADDLDGDGNVTESKCNTVDPVQVREAASSEILKWVKGDVGVNVLESTGLPSSTCPDNGGYTRYPCVAQVTPGGDFDYLIQTSNTGNVNLTDYWMYDILPFPGDTGVSGTLAGAQRGTEWDPVLAGPVTFSGGTGVVEYSNSSNPCRGEVGPAGTTGAWPAGCTDDWTGSFSAGARAFRVHLYGANSPWAAGGTITVRVPMTAPLSAPPSAMNPLDLSVAWNSVADVASRLNADGTTFRLLGGEPRKVGVIVPFPPISIGDYVWLDNNRDGVQGSAAAEPPVPGVTVELFNSSGDSLGTTTTDANGFYSFTDLYVGTDYKLVFTAPDGYTWTTQNAGSDDTVDSDVNPADGAVSFTTPTVTGQNSAVTPDVPIYDGGLVQYNLSIAKTLDSAGPFQPGSTVEFTLTPHNDGPAIALAGWSVTDILPSGLTLVSMDGGATYTCTGATCVSSVDLAAEADGDAITVTATIDASFTSGTLHNVAYVSPKEGDTVPETNLLEVPETTTDTDSTATDNDAQADLTVSSKISIGDYVWLDNNRDGQQGSAAAEPPVEGVTVELFTADGTSVGTTTTDANGFYSFTDLALDTSYELVFTAPGGYTWTTQNAGSDDTVDSDVNPTTGSVVFTTPSIGGTNSATEPDVPTYDGGLVQYNLSIAKTLDSAGPFYAGSTVEFTLTPHNDGPATALAGWSVTDILPAGLTLVSMDGGATYTCTGATCVSSVVLAGDTDGDPITVTATIDASFTSGTLHNVAYVSPKEGDTVPETNLLEVPETTTDTDSTATDNDAQAELTVASKVSIGDFVWLDNDRDGQQGDVAVEPPVAGVTVNLYAADGTTLVGTTVTDGNGFYSFVDLIPGVSYVVEFVKPDGYTFTDALTGASETDSNADVTTGRYTVVAPASGSNSATSPDDPTIDAGLWKYNLSIAKSLVTEGPFYDLYTVEFTLTPHNDGPSTALAGWSVTDILPAGLTLVSMDGGATYTCTGATCVSSVVLAGDTDGDPITVTATIDKGFVGSLHNVAYVSPFAEDRLVEDNLLEVPETTTDTDSTATDNDAQAELTVASKVSIGDFVWLDNDRDGQQGDVAVEPPVAGVTVNLYAADGTTLVGTTVTDGNGFYSFVDLIPGVSYVVEFVKPDGYTFTDALTGASETDSNADVTTGRYTVVAPASGSNSATSPDDPTIDAGLWKYNLSIAKSLVTEGPFYDLYTVEFTLTPHNDGPSTALAGWSVTDILPAGLTLVSMDGGATYTCTGATCVSSVVLAGDTDGDPITVTATIDKGFVGSLHNVAYVSPFAEDRLVEDNLLEVPETTTDTDSTATDNDAQAPLTVDSRVSIGDFVWLDNDRDGQQGDVAVEPPVAGVTVNLYAADGTTLVGTTVTDGNGFYSFVDLIPGVSYVVEFVKPDGYTFTDALTGASETDSNADVTTGRYTVVAPASGSNSATSPDDPTIDAGLVQYNLRLTKRLLTKGEVHPGSTVKFTLTPHNDGPATALAGWSVTDVLPRGLTAESIRGTGYTCDLATLTCVAAAPLVGGADGGVITIVATVNANFTGRAKNVAYVAPAPSDTTETNPLGEPPTTGTDTSTTPTDNDDQATVVVTPPPSGVDPDAGSLPDTGADPFGALTWAMLLTAAGAGLWLVARRRRRLAD